MLFAGDELGMEGEWGEDSRRPYPWTDESKWDASLLQEYRALAGMRVTASALADGGLRWVHVAEDVIAYLRESTSERLLIVVARDACTPCQIDVRGFGITAVSSVFGFGGVLQQDVLSVEIPSAGAGIWSIT